MFSPLNFIAQIYITSVPTVLTTVESELLTLGGIFLNSQFLPVEITPPTRYFGSTFFRPLSYSPRFTPNVRILRMYLFEHLWVDVQRDRSNLCATRNR